MSRIAERAGTWRRDEAQHGNRASAPVQPVLPAALVNAAERLLDQPDRWAGDALSQGEVENRILELLHAVHRDGNVVQPGESLGERILQQRLIDLLRAEALDQHTPGADPVADAQILAVLNRLDHIRRALDPSWHELMPARLAGSEGPTLIVEVAHDLRSPLTSIMFLAETLRKGRSGPIVDAQRKQLGIIYSAALGLSTVVADIIALVRGGDTEREAPGTFSITEVFDSVCDMVRPLAEEKGIELRLSRPDDDARIGSDVALSRVLLNLVTNALKFTDEGYVEVSAVSCGGNCVEFAVRDTGPGMDPELKNSLYRPFRRVANRQGFRFSGTGLGLSICRRTIESLGGELHFETPPDGGTRFFFSLDLPRVSRF